MRAERQRHDIPGQARPIPAEPGPAGVFEAAFPADSLAVRSALRAALARFLRQISEDEAGTLELVLAEVLNNIVEHGYAAGAPGHISLRIARDRQELACAVTDDGVPLPASCLERRLRPDAAMNSLFLPEGGFGWFLIHDLTCGLSYRREAGRNMLSFCLPLGAEGQPACSCHEADPSASA